MRHTPFEPFVSDRSGSLVKQVSWQESLYGNACVDKSITGKDEGKRDIITMSLTGLGDAPSLGGPSRAAAVPFAAGDSFDAEMDAMLSGPAPKKSECL